MTERNPLPDCLSHLAQFEVAVRERALREVLDICDQVAKNWPDASFGTDVVQERIRAEPGG